MSVHRGADPRLLQGRFWYRSDRKAIAVIGAGAVAEGSSLVRDAREVGALVARAGLLVVCGGLGGVMAAACRGAQEAGGLTVGLLPGDDPAAANPWVDVAVPTGLGEARNVLVVRAGAAVIAVGGGFGTLSEIALARKLGRPVVGLRTWSARGPDGSQEQEPLVEDVPGPARAVARALELAARPDALT